MITNWGAGLLAPAGLLISSALIAYHLIVFPAVVTALGRRRRHEGRVGARDWPPVAVITTAFNEVEAIDDRVSNLLAQDYSGDLLVVPVSDGSTDGTGDRLLRYRDHESVFPVVFEHNRGKTAALLEAVRLVPEEFEILSFGDANAHWESTAVSRLVQHFDDEAVGMVAGRLVYEDAGGEAEYRSWEERLKYAEARAHSCVGAEGSIFSIRRQLIPDLDPSLVEDFGFTLAVLQQGSVCAYEPRAISRERFGLRGPAEIRRRARIVNRGLRTLWAFRGLLVGKGGGTTAWMLWSHKVLRWSLPFLSLLWAVSALVVVARAWSLEGTVWLVALGTAVVLAVGALRRRIRSLLQGLAGVALGVVTAAMGRRAVRWVPVRAPDVR